MSPPVQRLENESVRRLIARAMPGYLVALKWLLFKVLSFLLAAKCRACNKTF
jgi:hypothetical protein